MLLNLQDLKIIKDKLTRQLLSSKEYQHEMTMMTSGIDRYQKNRDRHNKDNPLLNKPVSKLFANALPKIIEALEETLRQNNNKDTKTYKKAWTYWLDDLDIAEVCTSALNECFIGTLKDDIKPQTVAEKIADLVLYLKFRLGELQRLENDAVKTELKYIEKEAKAKYQNQINIVRYITKTVKRRCDHKVKSALYGKHIHEPNYNEKLSIGYNVLHHVINHSGLFVVEKDNDWKNGKFVTPHIFTLTDETVDAISKDDAVLQGINPRYKVMFDKPSPVGGKYGTSGYKSHAVRNTIKPIKRMQTEQKKAYETATLKGTMYSFEKGQNFIQSVPYAINTWIWEVISEDVQNGRTAGDNCPATKRLEKPTEKEYSIEIGAGGAELDKDQKLSYYIHCNGIEKFNRAVKSNKSVWALDKKAVVEILEHEENKFYLPIQPCYRSRVYNLPHLNHQREDRVRAVFNFYERKPLGEFGLFNLMVHIANCGSFKVGTAQHKVDKLLDKAKCQWVYDNFSKIEACVQKPFENEWWREADKPYMFLAACHEFIQAFYNPVGMEHFKSGLPCTLDSSSSGVQLYACMLRSTEDANLSNLIYEEGQTVANDVYGVVAKLCTKYAKEDVDEFLDLEDTDSEDYRKAQLAKLILDFGIDRKLVKRPTMTRLYTATLYGFTEQIMDDTMTPIFNEVLQKKREEHPFKDKKTSFDAARLIARYIWRAIEETLPAPTIAMGILEELAGVMAAENKPVIYTTPTGFPFINETYRETTSQISLALTDAKIEDVRVKPSITTTHEGSIDRAKAKSKICPNFIHSLDASLLILAANKIEDGNYGITALSTNHDAFSTHASDFLQLKMVLQHTMIEMFENNNPLQDILDENKAISENPHLIPEIPEDLIGDFNLNEIAKAPFAFS